MHPMYHLDVAGAVKIVMKVYSGLRALWYFQNMKYTTVILNIFSSWFLILDRPF